MRVPAYHILCSASITDCHKRNLSLITGKELEILHFPEKFRLGLGLHPTSCSIVTCGEAADRKAGDTTPFIIEAKNAWSYYSASPYVFIVCTDTHLPLQSVTVTRFLGLSFSNDPDVNVQFPSVEFEEYSYMQIFADGEEVRNTKGRASS